MTLRQLIACASPLNSPRTVRDHLRATDCGSLGGGGTGKDVFVPFTSLTCDLVDVILEGSLITSSYVADLEMVQLNAILTSEVYEADLINNTMNGDLQCQL